MQLVVVAFQKPVTERINNKRIFLKEEVEEIKKYFAGKKSFRRTKEEIAKEIVEALVVNATIPAHSYDGVYLLVLKILDK